MSEQTDSVKSDRRSFARKVVSVAALGGLASLLYPLLGEAHPTFAPADNSTSTTFTSSTTTATTTTAGNTVGGSFSAIAGGEGNTTTNDYDFIGGGAKNTASGPGAAIGGGGFDGTTTAGNQASGKAAAIPGGLGNAAAGDYAAIGGGQYNSTSKPFGAVGGGAYNAARGASATVPGGELNEAAGDYSLAAGQRAKIDAAHGGTFLWADQSAFDFNSAAANEFAVRATGGVRYEVTATTVRGSKSNQSDYQIANSPVGGVDRPVAALGVLGPPAASLHVAHQTTTDAVTALDKYNATGENALMLRRARGTQPAPAAVQAADTLGSLRMQGHDGSTFATGASIKAGAEAPWTPSAHATYLSFQTNSASAPTEQMRITSTGKVAIGGTNAPTAMLDVNGTTGYNQIRMRATFTPTHTADQNGNVGDIAWDDNHIYLRTSLGWKRAPLAKF